MLNFTRSGHLVATLGFIVTGLLALTFYAMNRPDTLTVAIGPDDRDHAQVMAALANKLQTDRANVRLKLVRKADLAETAKSLESGETQLAVVRSDRMPPGAQSVVIMNRTQLVFMAPARNKINDISDLSGKRLGVSRGSAENLQLLQRGLKEQDYKKPPKEIVPLTPQQITSALRDKKVDAVAVLGILQTGAFERALRAVGDAGLGKAEFFGVPNAEAVVQRHKMLEEQDVPKGAFGTSPLRPDDDMPTLAVTQRLVATPKVPDAVIGELTRLIFASRTALAQQQPGINSIEKPDTDADAVLPVHKGAVAYFEGTQQGFVERYSDWFYLLAMVGSMLVSGAGALWGLMTSNQRKSAGRFTQELLTLVERARHAGTPAELEDIEHKADALLTLAVKRVSTGEIDAAQFATFSTVNDCVRQAVQRRARVLATRAQEGQPAGAAPASSTIGA